MRAKAIPAVTHVQIEQAVRYFQAHGGLIRRLPDQKVAPLAAVGSRAQTVVAGLGMNFGGVPRLDIL